MKLRDLQNLLGRVKHRDEEAFEELCDFVKPIMMRVYRDFCVIELEYEDFQVEAQWLLYSITKTFDISKVKCFIPYYIIALEHLAIRYIRESRAKSRIPKGHLVTEFDEAKIKDCQCDNAETKLIMQEDEDLFFEQLSPYEQRVARDMLNGLTKVEIAKKVGKSVKSIRNVGARCRRKFVTLFRLEQKNKLNRKKSEDR